MQDMDEGTKRAAVEKRTSTPNTSSVLQWYTVTYQKWHTGSPRSSPSSYSHELPQAWRSPPAQAFFMPPSWSPQGQLWWLCSQWNWQMCPVLLLPSVVAAIAELACGWQSFLCCSVFAFPSSSVFSLIAGYKVEKAICFQKSYHKKRNLSMKKLGGSRAGHNGAFKL